MDQLNDLIQRHEMDTANLPNVEEAERKGKTSEKTRETSNTAAISFRRREFAQKTCTTSGRRNATQTRVARRTRSGLPRDEHRTLRTNAHPCADSSNAKILVDVHPNGAQKSSTSTTTIYRRTKWNRQPTNSFEFSSPKNRRNSPIT